MSDFGTMRTRIARETKRGDISAGSVAVADAIVDAIRYFRGRRFHFNEFADATATASSSTTQITIQTAFGFQVYRFDSIQLTAGSRRYPLIERQYDELIDKDSGVVFGYPDYYAVRGGAVRFYAPPSSDFPITATGVKDLTEVSAAAADAATNAWMTDAERVIRQRAKGNLWLNEFFNKERSDMFYAAAMDELAELRRQSRTSSNQGRIPPRA